MKKEIEIQELQCIADMTVKLTELRQNECKHLCIENAAPQIFHSLLSRFILFKNGKIIFEPQTFEQID